MRPIVIKLRGWKEMGVTRGGRGSLIGWMRLEVKDVRRTLDYMMKERGRKELV